LLSAALERLERTRAELEHARDAAAAHAAALAAQEAESARLLAELRDRRRSAWQEELRSARAFVRQLKDEGRAKLEALRGAAGERAALERFAREQLSAIAAREQAESAPAVAASPTLPGRVQIGDMVEITERGIQGELLQLDGARAWIQRGPLRFEVPAAQLRRIAGAVPARAQVSAAPAMPESGSGELSLIGLRAGEALDKLAGFLDRAVRAGEEHVRIIHGVGSGALRRAVQDYLATSPYCAGYRGGEAGEGGAGVTVATLMG
jgi:DNA mismatch repair protein MutS2